MLTTAKLIILMNNLTGFVILVITLGSGANIAGGYVRGLEVLITRTPNIY